MNLAQLQVKQKAIITKVNLSTKDKNRLMYIGIYVGATITFLQCAPCQDPLLFEVGGNEVILRTEVAKNIMVEVENEGISSSIRW